MKIICVCGYCGEHTSEEATIELNFRDHIIYFFCYKCKNENKIELKPDMVDDVLIFFGYKKADKGKKTVKKQTGLKR